MNIEMLSHCQKKKNRLKMMIWLEVFQYCVNANFKSVYTGSFSHMIPGPQKIHIRPVNPRLSLTGGL